MFTPERDGKIGKPDLFKHSYDLDDFSNELGLLSVEILRGENDLEKKILEKIFL